MYVLGAGALRHRGYDLNGGWLQRVYEHDQAKGQKLFGQDGFRSAVQLVSECAPDLASRERIEDMLDMEPRTLFSALDALYQLSSDGFMGFPRDASQTVTKTISRAIKACFLDVERSCDKSPLSSFVGTVGTATRFVDMNWANAMEREIFHRVKPGFGFTVGYVPEPPSMGCLLKPHGSVGSFAIDNARRKHYPKWTQNEICRTYLAQNPTRYVYGSMSYSDADTDFPSLIYWYPDQEPDACAESWIPYLVSPTMFKNEYLIDQRPSFAHISTLIQRTVSEGGKIVFVGFSFRDEDIHIRSAIRNGFRTSVGRGYLNQAAHERYIKSPGVFLVSPDSESLERARAAIAPAKIRHVPLTFEEWIGKGLPF